MTTKKILTLIALTLILTCTQLYADPNEPNQTDPNLFKNLTFKISSETQEVRNIRGQRPVNGRLQQIYQYLPIHPIYVVKLSVNQQINSFSEFVEFILTPQNPYSLSKEQTDLILTGVFSKMDKDTPIKNYHQVDFYAMSKEDAKKMAKAYLDYLTISAAKDRQRFKNELEKYQNSLSRIQEKLPEAKQKHEIITSKLDELKKSHPYLDEEEAKKIAAEFNKRLLDLNIEIAGIHASLVETQQTETDLRERNFKSLADKLQQTLIEQSIAMAGAKARKKQIDDSLNQLALIPNEKEARNNLSNIKTAIKNYESEIKQLKDSLNRSSVTPPKVLGNKITIHPVKPVESTEN